MTVCSLACIDSETEIADIISQATRQKIHTSIDIISIDDCRDSEALGNDLDIRSRSRQTGREYSIMHSLQMNELNVFRHRRHVSRR